MYPASFFFFFFLHVISLLIECAPADGFVFVPAARNDIAPAKYILYIVCVRVFNTGCEQVSTPAALSGKKIGSSRFWPYRVLCIVCGVEQCGGGDRRDEICQRDYYYYYAGFVMIFVLFSRRMRR